MNLKKEVLNKLDPILHKIIEITCEVASISAPMCDPWLASIDDHTFDEEADLVILKKLEDYYALDLGIFQGYEPLLHIAMFIWINLEEDEE